MSYLSRSFFYRYGAHRDLHSFPTRRSSDLELDGFLATKPERPMEVQQAEQARARLLEWQVERHLRIAAFYERGDAQVALDRKSTRLNSSHLGISYAVFCLKKKNKKKIPNYS